MSSDAIAQLDLILKTKLDDVIEPGFMTVQEVQTSVCADILKDDKLSEEQKSKLVQTIMQESSKETIQYMINIENAKSNIIPDNEDSPDKQLKIITEEYKFDLETQKEILLGHIKSVLDAAQREFVEKLEPVKELINKFMDLSSNEDATIVQYKKDKTKLTEFMKDFDVNNADNKELLEKLKQRINNIDDAIVKKYASKYGTLAYASNAIDQHIAQNQKGLFGITGPPMDDLTIFKTTKAYKIDYAICMAHLRQQKQLCKSTATPRVECLDYEEPSYIYINSDRHTLRNLLPLIKNGRHLLPENLDAGVSACIYWQMATVMYYLGFEFDKSNGNTWWKKTNDTLPRYYLQKACNLTEFTRTPQ